MKLMNGMIYHFRRIIYRKPNPQEHDEIKSVLLPFKAIVYSHLLRFKISAPSVAKEVHSSKALWDFSCAVPPITILSLASLSL